jgi:hypothetical protein
MARREVNHSTGLQDVIGLWRQGGWQLADDARLRNGCITSDNDMIRPEP